MSLKPFIRHLPPLNGNNICPKSFPLYPECIHGTSFLSLQASHQLHAGGPIRSNLIQNGSIAQYKACLVARRFSQQYGLYYEKTFAPVAKMTTIRTLILLHLFISGHFFNFDVKNAFLHGHLSEQVYMEPPSRASHPPNHVCLLRCAFYDIKHAPRAWFECFTSIMLSANSFVVNMTAMFVKPLTHSCVIVLLCVDDMIISGDDSHLIQQTKNLLQSQFDMIDLGRLWYFLGLEVANSPRGILLSQKKYTWDLLSRVALTDQHVDETIWSYTLSCLLLTMKSCLTLLDTVSLLVALFI